MKNTDDFKLHTSERSEGREDQNVNNYGMTPAMNSKISTIAYYLPEKEVSNEDLAKEFEGFNFRKVSKKLGISSRQRLC